jgi:hypothetical protein
MMRTFVAAAVAFLVFPAGSAHADEWTVGPGIAYVSKINDVVDIYKDNLKAQGKTVDVSKAVPIGVSFAADRQWDSGLRVGFGVGPYFRLTGDVKHFELPINGTVGYLFLPNEQSSPYVKGGIVHHVVSGDFYSSSQPGLLVAGGFDLARRSPLGLNVELAFDQSKIELNTVCGVASAPGCKAGTVKLRSYETVLSLFVKF